MVSLIIDFQNFTQRLLFQLLFKGNILNMKIITPLKKIFKSYNNYLVCESMNGIMKYIKI